MFVYTKCINIEFFVMVKKIQKWGNSLAIRLPKTVTMQLGLREGSEVGIAERNDKIVISRLTQPQRKFRKDEWENFLLPTKKKREGVSERIDEVVYG